MKVKRCGYRLAAVLAVLVFGTSTVFAQEKKAEDEINIQEEDLIINSGGTADEIGRAHV